MEKRVLVLGARGMAGHVISSYLKSSKKFKVFDLSRYDESDFNVDIQNSEALFSAIRESQPDVIINCICLLVEPSKRYPAEAIYANAYFPHFLKKHSGDAKIIHLSTDCVFSGKDGSYSENSYKDAVDVYGKTKGLGELNNTHDLTIRTSFVGPELKKDGTGLFHWLLSQEVGANIQGFENVYWSGVTTLELARAIPCFIEQNLTGLFNLTQTEKISKYELLQHIRAEFKRSDLKLTGIKDPKSDKSLVSIRNDLDFKVLDYTQMFQQLRVWMDEHADHYRKYYPFLYE